MTKTEIEEAERRRAQQVAEEARRIQEADHQHQRNEHNAAAYAAFRSRYPDANREMFDRLTATERTSRKALEGEFSTRPPDAMSRATEEQRQRDSQARVEALVKSEAEKEARQKALEEELERAIEPDKERAKRQWLADHAASGKTAADFDRFVWPNLRPNVIADREAHFRLAQRESLLASGQYSF